MIRCNGFRQLRIKETPLLCPVMISTSARKSESGPTCCLHSRFFPLVVPRDIASMAFRTLVMIVMPCFNENYFWNTLRFSLYILNMFWLNVQSKYRHGAKYRVWEKSRFSFYNLYTVKKKWIRFLHRRLDQFSKLSFKVDQFRERAKSPSFSSYHLIVFRLI